ncbi:MAG: HyaD/HybD family hydrogenase maturation endopeptidase [Campylobacterota bacterium]|nr:HyaD/HybD family hydrogenase maturation endopeptidase [Campylobacterota bacterium]
MSRIIVIGVGNILFLDEGVGVYAAAYLDANYSFSPPIEIIDGGTLGVRLSEYFLAYDDVIICDTVSIDDKAGSVYALNDEALSGLGKTAQSVHEIEITQMLETCKMAGKCADVGIVGVVPEDIETVAFGLSRHLKDAFPQMIETIISLLETKGITVQKGGKSTPLSEIIAGYTTATAPR